MFLLASFAHASPTSSGIWLPGAATPAERRGGMDVSAGGAVLFAEGANALGGGSVCGWFAAPPAGSLALDGCLAWVHRTADASDSLLAVGSVRYEVLRQERVALTPWVGVLAQPRGVLFPFGTVAAAGLAAEFRWGRTTLDLSVPLVLVPIQDPGYFYATESARTEGVAAILVASDLGVAFDLGEGHALRVGKALFLPELAWRKDFGGVHLEAAVAPWLLLNTARLSVGFAM